ncbi:NAD(P)H-dependent oxidoreductase, partial [Hymenobacter terrenus]|uniref:NAD(P)H-dependent oxidoreductase n=1 Tax=Hymenobacter terrenus TaxID=1629124 RepID=UPI000619CAFB
MTKTLIIVTHPDLSASVANKQWVEALGLYPERFTLHDLYGQYAAAPIDVAREQALVEEHDKIIFQFPFYWFNCP